MNMVLLDIMRTEIPHWLDGESFATNFNFVALHRFLNSSAHIAYTYVNPSGLSQSLANALVLNTM